MTQTISPLRQRMIDDMRLRNFAASSQQSYVRAVANFSRHFRQSPEQLGFDDVRDYHLHLIKRGLKATTISQILCALRFFYGTTLGIKDASEQIPLPKIGDSLPAVLTSEEVARFLDRAPSLKMRALFTTIYAAGLRVSEVTHLTVDDIDSHRMTIFVRLGKRRRDRHVMLAPELLPLLRRYWIEARPLHWLFIEGLLDLQRRDKIRFHGALADLAEPDRLRATLDPLKRREWVVYAKEPFAGPGQVLAYLARYTHRVAISNRRIVSIEDDHVSFRWRDYRAAGRRKPKTMQLSASEFIRRFLMHVLPAGFHRIRHNGLFANGHRRDMIARQLLDCAAPDEICTAPDRSAEMTPCSPPCPQCGGSMCVTETFEGVYPRRRYPRRQDGL